MHKQHLESLNTKNLVRILISLYCHGLRSTLCFGHEFIAILSITMWIPVFLLSTKSSLEQNLVRLSQNIYLTHAIVQFLSSILFEWTRLVLGIDSTSYPWYHQCVTTFPAYSVKILNPIILLRNKAFKGRGKQVLLLWFISAPHAGGGGTKLSKYMQSLEISLNHQAVGMLDLLRKPWNLFKTVELIATSHRFR